MPTHLNSPTPEEINKWSVAKPELDGKTFEFGLVLGGTVSAGAYTAGVLDFLFEALDAWTDAKQRNDPLAPKHEVRLKVIAGASGGGVNAVIAARALAFNYPAVTRGSLKANTPTGNPFFDTWCSLQFDGFLDTADLKKGGIRSLLNGKPIDDAAKALTDFYLANAALIREAVGKLGFTCIGGDNAPYIWVNTGRDSWEFFDLLLNKAQVVCTPGAGFGKCGEGHVRISAFNSRENVVTALARIATALK